VCVDVRACSVFVNVCIVYLCAVSVSVSVCVWA